MPVMCAEGFFCAAIKAIKPLPVPMSSIFLQWWKWAHAPSNTPSKPTLCAHRWCFTSNCLKTKGFSFVRPLIGIKGQVHVHQTFGQAAIINAVGAVNFFEKD